MIQHFTSIDGTKIAYRDEGAGAPVLCLSGLTRNGSDFDYSAPHLGDVRLIRMDYRGRGASDWADPASYTIMTEAQDALALLDHLGVGRAAILGTSRGGMIAMFLGLTAKARLSGACLVDIGPDLSREGLTVIKGYIGKNPVAKSMRDVALARARMLNGFANVPEARWLEEAQKHFVDTGDGLRINYDPDLARIFDENADAPAAPPDIWPWFDALGGLPLALIRGANSDLLSRETAAEMQRRRPDMVFGEVPDRGHVPFLDEPEAVAVLRNWVESL
ncbi:Hydrolase, alpha/beta fold family functionally coupled to Phosphoribulokinase [Candidatus Rhodobacter oscarellae]|uniref:Hydrolase, alpha/beta fold family functionally coupled to Phosphoribulokinase n=1 Tax=Candidatus Rhodobacter oscarellae TaxID=1675527 RepID=A0A0J9E757_9RHOB|nr:alpha/beta hydrolase [Candidatus Rhodobacter lobularis]KMW58542.1 Hydrolase, alpha/beta fold family functionally coupled to Phosphoribulokinase [Candidatus Rhodobacter lobularis]